MTAPARVTRRPTTAVERKIVRLKHDFEAWARKCYTIRTKAHALAPFVLYPLQRAIGEAEDRMIRETGNARLFALKARQGGVSTYEQARSLHLVWGTPYVDALTMADIRDRTDAIFEITSRAIDHFPETLLPTLGTAQTREISFPANDSKFRTDTAGSGDGARGLTLARLHCSEFAFYEDPEAVLRAAVGAMVQRGSVVTLETTASGYDSEAHVFWREAKERGYRTLFFPWWECDPVNYRLPLLADDEIGTLEPEEQELQRRHGLDLEQIKWRRAKIREFRRQGFLTEYAEDEESCWAAVGGMFYDVDTLKALRLRAPVVRETHLGGALELYDAIPQAPARGVGPNPERVIIGADTAEGVDGDRSTFVARTFPSWRLLAKYEDARVTPKDFAAILDTWGRKFGTALLVPEKNAHGITVIRHLRDDHRYPVDRIYHRVALDKPFELAQDRIGWYTSGESQPLLLDAGTELFNAARDGVAGVPSVAALTDAFAVRRDKHGKVKLNGKDVLVAEMLAWMGRAAPLFEILIGRA